MEYSESERLVRERYQLRKEEKEREQARLNGVEPDDTASGDHVQGPVRGDEADEETEEVDNEEEEEEERIKSEADALELELLGEGRFDLMSDRGNK